MIKSLKVTAGLLTLLICIGFLLSCSRSTPSGVDALGDVDFTVTGSSEAQPFFKHGLLLLHSFEYTDAATAFRKAKELDPAFTMAYWGEAMTYNHGLWRYQAYDEADSVLQMLAPTAEERVAKAQTQLEKDFIAGVNILYGTGDKIARDSSYAAYLGELYQKYPGNNEVAAFYSVALIGSVPVGRDTKVYEHAADIAKEVLARNPRHPGALHYLIHAYDDPEHAALAMQTADAYAIVAPDAGHALHMPSHIYLASGLWDKVVSSNEAAWAAGQHRKEQLHLTNDALNYHAFHWLLYGYLQQGRTADARKLVDEMQGYCDSLSNKRSRSHLIYLKTTYQVETGDYTGDIAAIDVSYKDLNISTRALNHFTNGMKALQMQDAVTLDSITTLMTAERLLDEERVSGTGVQTCGSTNSSVPDALDIQYAKVMELELKGMLASMRGNMQEADMLLKQAVDEEISASYAYGPPSIVKPSYELYAEWLMNQGRPSEALAQYAYALKVFPNRRLLLKGKAQAERAMEVG